MLSELSDKILKIPADYGEIHYETAEFTNVVVSKDEIETVKTAKTTGGNTRVLKNGGWGFASFNSKDFDPYLSAALKNADLTGRSKSEISILKEPITDEIITEVKDSPSNYSLSDKYDLVRSYNERLKDDRIDFTKVVFRDSTVTKYYVNSEGSQIKQTKTFTGASLMVMARDGMNIQRAYESTGQYGGMELVFGLEEKAEEIKERAIALLSAPKIQAGTYKVLMDPNLAGVFAHEAFGHLSEADFLYENPRMQDVMVLGRRFGPEFLNIVDDGSLKGLAGYTPYDDEGIPARKNYLIKDGKLCARLHSRETAGKMGEGLSGNGRALSAFYQPIVRMTNTFIEEGNSTLEEMLSQMGDGIYALDMLGGMTNLEMFTFSAGYAYRVEGGQIKELLRDVVLSGNVFETLENILAVGNDLSHYGGLGGCGKGGQSGLPVSTGSPHVLAKNILVGGS